MFVNFSNEEDRNKAISRIDGYDLKGKKLKAFVAQASKDPLKKLREKGSDDGKVCEFAKKFTYYCSYGAK